MTVRMEEVQQIRELYRRGASVAEIARRTGRSEPTVRKYLRKEDLSPEPPSAGKRRPSCVDDFEPIVRGWLEEDARGWHKQRHSAQRVWERLRDECGCEASYWTVRRLVERVRAQLGAPDGGGYLDLVWSPGEAQADFGECDVRLRGVRQRMKFLVLCFPHSNVAVAQLFPGENAECVCQGLRDIFEFVGGVPPRIVFDNAAGVGRKVCDGFRATETFSAFAAQYGFRFSFCNPDSGHEKGAVEAKVRYVRQHLFVPVPAVWDLAAFNRRLASDSLALSYEKPHYLSGVAEGELFLDDSLALLGLPGTPYDVVRYERRRADKQGKFTLGVHRYSSDPSLAGRDLVVGLRALTVEVFDPDGTLVAAHPRAYGDAPTDTSDPARQLPLLCNRPAAWPNSLVRASMPDPLRAYGDALAERGEVGGLLRALRDESASSGYAAALAAAEGVLAATGQVDPADLALAAAVASSGGAPVAYDEPVDLSVYDAAFAGRAR